MKTGDKVRVVGTDPFHFGDQVGDVISPDIPIAAGFSFVQCGVMRVKFPDGRIYETHESNFETANSAGEREGK